MVEAVDQGYVPSVFSQKAGQGEEAKRSYPEIVGSEVSDPGVDEENVRGRMFHVKHLLVKVQQGIPKDVSCTNTVWTSERTDRLFRMISPRYLSL